MSATLDLFNLACKKNDIATPYAAAKAMNLSKESIYRWINRGGTADDDTVMMMCELAGEDPAVWAPLIHAERAKTPAIKKLWKSIADKAARAAVLVLAVLALAGPTPSNAPGKSLNSPTFDTCILCKKPFDQCILCKILKWLLRASLIGLVGLGYYGRTARADDWTPTDTAWQITYTTVLAADLIQTHRIVSNGDRESNPILGEQPTHGTVTVAILSAGLGHYLIARGLPPTWRRAWQIVWIGIEAGAVHTNRQAGIKIAF